MSKFHEVFDDSPSPSSSPMLGHNHSFKPRFRPGFALDAEGDSDSDPSEADTESLPSPKDTYFPDDNSLYDEPTDLDINANPFRPTDMPPPSAPVPIPTTLHCPPTSATDPHPPLETPPAHPQTHPRPQNTTTSTAHPTRHLKTLFHVSLALLLLPAHLYLLYASSVYTILEAWGFAAVVTLYFVASCILVLGIVVPPFMLLHWIWEVWCEDDGSAEGQDAGHVGLHGRRNGAGGNGGQNGDMVRLQDGREIRVRFERGDGEEW